MQMTKLAFAALPLVTVFALGCSSEATEGVDIAANDEAEQAQGNGAPKGGHDFSMNLVGVPQGKSADMTGNNGHRMFIALDGKSDIYMGVGPDFAILDANGTDGSASMECKEYVSDDGQIQYMVWARVLGKPGGSMNMTPCATVDGETYCSVSSYVAVREKGKSTFTNVTKELLTITYDIDGDGTYETVPMFDDSMESYFWSYDNYGCKNVQLRFTEPTW